MKVKISQLGDRKQVSVLLSKRNLDTLVKLYGQAEQGEALAVLHRFDVSEDTHLSVYVQPDDSHYSNRLAEGRRVGIGPEDV